MLGVPVIAEGCREEGVKMEHRLPVIVTHGLCHLLGYRHDSELQWRKVGGVRGCGQHRKIGSRSLASSICATNNYYIPHLEQTIILLCSLLTSTLLAHTQQMYARELSLLTAFNTSFGTKLKPLTEFH